jgi:hypothetical protein
MPDIKIVKLKLRRGPEFQRKLVVLDQGELGYVTDNKRVFVGDGSTLGGTVIGTKIFTPITSNKTGLNAYTGDVVVENNLMYQLTGTNSVQTSAWKLISPIVDNSTIEYNSGASNVMRIKPDGVGIAQLGNITYSQGGIIMNNTQGLSANVDKTTIIVNTSNQLAISTVYASSIVGQINNTQIDTATLAGSALQSAGNKLDVQVDNSTIVITSNQLTVGTLDAGAITSGTFGASRIDTTVAGQGLQGGGGVAISTNLDANSLTYNDSNQIVLNTLYKAARIPLSSNDVNFGGFTSSITQASAVATLNDILSTVGTITIVSIGAGYTYTPTVSVQPPPASPGFFAASAVAIVNNGTLSAITITDAGSGYNFTPQILIDPPPHSETLYQVVTATTTGGVLTGSQTFQLSSAGFVMMHFGAELGVFAVPVFKVPSALQNLTVATVTV